MATDNRGHTVPAGTDVFSPQTDMGALSASVNDLVLTANGTATTAALTALSPTAARPVLVRQQDTNGLYLATSTTPVLIGPVGGGAKRTVMSANNTFINPTSWAPLPVDNAAATLTYVKQSSATRLLIYIRATLELSSGAAQLIHVGANVNGTTTEVGSTPYLTAVSRDSIDGIVSVTGVAAGTVTIAPMIMASASQINLYSGLDSVIVSVTECP